jgi:hypothetical protein
MVFWFSFEDIYAQSENVITNINSEYNYGGILCHSNELPSISSNQIHGFTLNYDRIPISKEKWEQCYCFPQITYGLAYYNFGDPQILGYSLNSFMAVAPYLNPRGKLHFVPRFAGGLSYVSQVYDEVNNPDNNFFSSHISGFLQLDLSLRYNISNHFLIKSGMSYNHISNGGLKQPNKGMNFITANLGLSYVFSDKNFPDYQVDAKNFDLSKRWYYTFSGSYTLKVAQKENGFKRKNTSVTGILATAGYFVPRFSVLQGGVEFISDGYLKEQLNRQLIIKDHNRFALIVGHTARFGKLSLATLLGVYVYSPYEAMDPVYQRYLLTYDIWGNLFAGVGLKAHRHVAELMMVNIGVRL